MLQPGRTFSAVSGYRYGFNGKEKSPEISSDDYDFGARIYDGRIGRWLSVDPLLQKYPMHSPYDAMGNNPICNIDPDGKYFVGADGKKVSVSVDKKGMLVLGKNATDDLMRIAKLVNESGSKTAIKEMNDNGQSKTKIHVVIDKENTGKDGFSLMGYHQPHDASGKALTYLQNPDRKSGKWDGTVAFIKDDKGKDIFKEATITIFEKSFTPDKVKRNLEHIGIYDNKASKKEYMVAVFTHEQYHDRDEENIKSAKDNQEGRPNTVDVESRAYQITRDVMVEIKTNRKE
jgi:RHS repeat-associated protein